MYIMPDPNGSCDVLAFFALYAVMGRRWVVLIQS